MFTVDQLEHHVSVDGREHVIGRLLGVVVAAARPNGVDQQAERLYAAFKRRHARHKVGYRSAEHHEVLRRMGERPSAIRTPGFHQLSGLVGRHQRTIERLEPIDVNRLDQSLFPAEVRVNTRGRAPGLTRDAAHGQRRRTVTPQHRQRCVEQHLAHVGG